MQLLQFTFLVYESIVLELYCYILIDLLEHTK